MENVQCWLLTQWPNNNKCSIDQELSKLLYRCQSEASYSLTMRQHSYAWSDFVAAVLKLWHHIRTLTVSRCLFWTFLWRTFLSNFIQISFEITLGIFNKKKNNNSKKMMSGDVRSVPGLKILNWWLRDSHGYLVGSYSDNYKVYWVLGDIHRYWIVLLLWDISLLWYPILYRSDSSRHHPHASERLFSFACDYYSDSCNRLSGHHADIKLSTIIVIIIEFWDFLWYRL